MSSLGHASVYVNFWIQLMNRTIDENGNKMFEHLTEDEKTSDAVNTYIALAVGMVLGPSPMGIIQDKYGHKTALIYLCTNTVIFCTLLII